MCDSRLQDMIHVVYMFLKDENIALKLMAVLSTHPNKYFMSTEIETIRGFII